MSGIQFTHSVQQVQPFVGTNNPPYGSPNLPIQRSMQQPQQFVPYTGRMPSMTNPALINGLFGGQQDMDYGFDNASLQVIFGDDNNAMKPTPTNLDDFFNNNNATRSAPLEMEQSQGNNNIVMGATPAMDKIGVKVAPKTRKIIKKVEGKPTKRTAQACEPCRISKAKCNVSAGPCTNCHTKGIPCMQEDKSTGVLFERGKQDAVEQGLRNRLEEMSNEKEALAKENRYPHTSQIIIQPRRDVHVHGPLHGEMYGGYEYKPMFGQAGEPLAQSGGEQNF